MLRGLRDDLKAEIEQFTKSKYFLNNLDQRTTEHFDYEQMVTDFAQRYPAVGDRDLRGVIGYALYYYYLR